MSTKKTTPPPKSIQESDLGKVENLVRQLDAVKHIADSGYWLTTEELSMLLGLDSATTASFVYKKESYGFAWRNFDCTLMRRQDKLSFWSIRSQTSQTLEFQNLNSLEVESDRIPIPSPENLVILPSHLQNTSAEMEPPQNHVVKLSQGNGLVLPTQASYNQNQESNQHQESQEAESGIIPTVYAQIDNLLTWNQLRQLFKYVIDQEPNFVPTTNSANDPFYRRSMYLFSFPEFARMMIDRVRSIMPHIISHLDIQNFTVGDIEAQLTAHNDGNYYKIHNDNGSPDCANRELTYVYYFHREPKAFSGGELVLYDSVIKDGYLVGAKSFKTIQPRNNTIVFFPSRCMHEVLPVVCPSKAFADSRFTINGWVRHR
ncbi:2OG-Fe(II) oxygenase [Tumidithrix elongata RA019]|uniref:2OG-Fe(II) oxygenase n=1 Tax=Tumidithrix elongata BACA0141 TaxID=2716417 RepID=A0AAW9PQL3_9CYAN|nr:2OG-Fe(II) oxygenase [Tumidithrix elongata RA019]